MIKLTEKQQQIVDSNARIKLIMGAQRSGKTLISLLYLFDKMKQKNNRNTKAVIYTVNSAQYLFLGREIKGRIDKEILINIKNNHECIEFETIHGTISVEIFNYEEFKEYRPNIDIIVIDSATRNKYLGEIYQEYKVRLIEMIIVGHCPEDETNTFYKIWNKAYANNDDDIKAFKLKTWDNPTMTDKKEEWERDLLKHMTLERYIRDYYATII